MSRTVRLNYLAILVSAIVYFIVAAGWFTLFQQQWLDGVGRTREWLTGPGGISPVVQYGTAFVSALLIATALSCVIQTTGEQTAARGVKAAVLLWVGFVFTTWATEYVFEARTLQTLAINAGFPLVGMIVQGAIIGAWKAKPA